SDGIVNLPIGIHNAIARVGSHHATAEWVYRDELTRGIETVGQDLALAPERETNVFAVHSRGHRLDDLLHRRVYRVGVQPALEIDLDLALSEHHMRGIDRTARGENAPGTRVEFGVVDMVARVVDESGEVAVRGKLLTHHPAQRQSIVLGAEQELICGDAARS